ncbi:MAG: hypothetical protein LBT63_00430 [Holosporaceae bacterium]|jgi:MtN3 and saliva related transmembrane protein|nr:hypothetical protein [Holosporaceae bacterium]
MPEGLVYFVELMFGVGMFVNAALFIPQAVKIYRTREVGDLSILMFVGFNVVQIFSILHGYIHRDFILMAGFLLSLIFSGTITVLILLYDKKD